MKPLAGMDLPSNKIIAESLTTFFDDAAVVCCCAFAIEIVLIPLMRRVIVIPVRKIAVAINPTENLF